MTPRQPCRYHKTSQHRGTEGLRFLEDRASLEQRRVEVQTLEQLDKPQLLFTRKLCLPVRNSIESRRTESPQCLDENANLDGNVTRSVDVDDSELLGMSELFTTQVDYWFLMFSKACSLRPNTARSISVKLGAVSQPNMATDSVMSRSTNKCSLRDTMLPELWAHAPSAESGRGRSPAEPRCP